MKNKTSFLIIALIVIGVFSNSHASTNPSISSNEIRSNQKANTNIKEWIETELHKVIEENNIPAVSVAIIQNGKISLIENLGVRNRKTNESININSIYQISSLSKMFTGIIANNLVIESKLDIDDLLINYLPTELSTKEIEKIKIRDLLFHRAGFPYKTDLMKKKNELGEVYSREGLLNDLASIKLKFKPGEKFGYSNMGYALLGLVLEKATHKSYKELLNDFVIEKYNLEQTSVKPSKKQITDLLVTPYKIDDKSTATETWEAGSLMPAGGLYSSINDMAKILKKQIDDYIVSNGNDHNSMPLRLTHFKHALDKSKKSFYGFGLFENISGKDKIYKHIGGMGGYASHYTFSSKHKYGVVILTSSGGKWIRTFADSIMEKLKEN